jgi:hypothetical protein
MDNPLLFYILIGLYSVWLFLFGLTLSLIYRRTLRKPLGALLFVLFAYGVKGLIGLPGILVRYVLSYNHSLSWVNYNAFLSYGMIFSEITAAALIVVLGGRAARLISRAMESNNGIHRIANKIGSR